MPATFAMPQNFEQDTAAILPDLILDEIFSNGEDELLSALPFSYIDASKVRWDQHQNAYGLIPVRGVDAPPDLVKMPGLKTYEADPGFYGLVTQLRESEILFERQPNTVNEPIDPADRLSVLSLNCAAMVVSRFRQTAAALLGTGQFTNANASGELTHHYKLDDYQTFSPANDGSTGPGWAASPSTAKPISDLIYWQTKKLNKGTSADFGPTSSILVNPETVNDFWNTDQVQNAYKNKFGSSFMRGGTPNLDGDNSINALLMGMGLPPFKIYSKGYYATLAAAATENPDQFTYAIPSKTLIWLGNRPKGQQIGAWKLTRHAGIDAYQGDLYPSIKPENLEMIQRRELSKGIYVRAHFHDRMPHRYDIEMGFNACPILYYRRATAGITYA